MDVGFGGMDDDDDDDGDLEAELAALQGGGPTKPHKKKKSKFWNRQIHFTVLYVLFEKYYYINSIFIINYKKLIEQNKKSFIQILVCTSLLKLY